MNKQARIQRVRIWICLPFARSGGDIKVRHACYVPLAAASHDTRTTGHVILHSRRQRQVSVQLHSYAFEFCQRFHFKVTTFHWISMNLCTIWLCVQYKEGWQDNMVTGRCLCIWMWCGKCILESRLTGTRNIGVPFNQENWKYNAKLYIDTLSFCFKSVRNNE